MEHRYYPRFPASLEADVFHGQQLLGRFHTRDISLDGMFLKTGPTKLTRNDILRLRLGMRGEKHSMQGMVVHTSQQGVGVMLSKMDKDVFRTFAHQRNKRGQQ